MESVITQENFFNSSYSRKNKHNTMRELLACAVSSGTLSDEQAAVVIGKYRISMTNLILGEYDISEDVQTMLKDGIKECMRVIDNHLDEMDTPFAALSYIVTNDPTMVIEYCKKVYEQERTSIVDKLNELENGSKMLSTLSTEYANYLMYLRAKLSNKSFNTVYSLMCGLNPMDVESLSDISNLIDASMKELSIVDKFPKKDIEKMLKGFKLDDITKNIAATVLYNYFFNAFYKGGTEVSLSDAQDKIVKSGIKAGIFDSEDIVDIVETGDIKFTSDDKRYIYCYFVPSFNDEIINKKHIDRTVKG